jgi:hypothetical protein
MIGQKGEKTMKTMTSVLAVLVLAGAMGSSIASAEGTDGMILKDTLADGSYCHMKFPAIDERTLGSKHPVLTDPSWGDIIDFYGPCNHDPLGQEEVHAQLLEFQHRWARDYMN